MAVVIHLAVSVAITGALSAMAWAVSKKRIEDKRQSKLIFFTQEFVKEAQKSTNKNVLIVHPEHELKFEKDQIFDVQKFRELDCDYTAYVLGKGTFILKGDGGWANWAMCGYFDKENDKTVVFYEPPIVKHETFD